MATIQFKRGTAARWADLNPVLENGEPGFAYDTRQFKIGDGVTHWNDLPYIQGETGVANFATSADFPAIGFPNVIYKAANEQALYQFNTDTNTYEKVSDGAGIGNIDHINGGEANG